MHEMRKLDSKSHDWLTQQLQPKFWSRSHFRTTPKCDILINDHSEVFNSFILEVRQKPIIAMMECIRNLLMVMIMRNREKMNKEPAPICPRNSKEA